MSSGRIAGKVDVLPCNSVVVLLSVYSLYSHPKKHKARQSWQYLYSTIQFYKAIWCGKNRHSCSISKSALLLGSWGLAKLSEHLLG